MRLNLQKRAYTLLLFANLVVAPSFFLSAQIRISELQPVPAAGEPEWVELLNTGGASVDVGRWQLCDLRQCTRLPNAFVRAGGYVVVTRDTSALRETRWIPPTTLLLEASVPSLNNSTETVFLRHADSTLVDSVAFDMKRHVKGRSIEVAGTLFGTTLTLSNQLRSCNAADSATCGLMNSAVELEYDIMVTGFGVSNSEVEFEFLNVGRRAVSSLGIRLTVDYALSERNVLRIGTLNAKDIRREISSSSHSMGPGDKHVWRLHVDELRRVRHDSCKWLDCNVLVWISTNDDRRSNDSLQLLLWLPPPNGSVSFTEIMFDPWSGTSDYVEIYNGWSDTIFATGWKVEDAENVPGIIQPVTKFNSPTLRKTDAVAPGEYLLVAMDTTVKASLQSKPSVNWNATSDYVALRTPSGFLVDEFSYDYKWHSNALPSGRGISLEKLSPLLVSNSKQSWTSSGALEGGSPGAPNSVAIDLPTSTILEATPSPFSSERGHARHPTIIRFEQPFRHATASLSVFTPEGVLVKRLLNSSFVGAEGAVAWDGTNEFNNRVERGPYVVVLESVDAASSKTFHNVCVVVVGE